MYNRTYLEHLAEFANQSARTVAREDSNAAHLGLFQANHTGVYAWLQANRGGNSFAKSLWADLHRYGSLTEKQRQAVERSLNQPTGETTNVDGSGFVRLVASFQRAKATGLKWPKMHIGSLVFSMASATSKNPGYLYIKATGEYVGKVSPTGQFAPAYACSPEQRALIASIAQDPLAHAVAHGHATGHCAVCSRKLTDSVSVERGIGPICADKFGF